MDLAAQEVPAKLYSGCAGCIAWDSPAASPDGRFPCATRAGSSHRPSLIHTAQPGTAQPDLVLLQKQSSTAADDEWWGWRKAATLPPWLPADCRSPLAISAEGDISGGDYTPGGLISLSRGLLQWLKLKSALTMQFPVKTLCIYTPIYIYMYNKCIYSISIARKTGQPFKLPVCQHTVQTGSSTAVTGH